MKNGHCIGTGQKHKLGLKRCYQTNHYPRYIGETLNAGSTHHPSALPSSTDT
jgi:hypothetical protein